MKQIGKYFSVLFVLLAVLVLAAYSPLTAAAAKADKPAKADKTAKLDKMAKAEAFFDVNKMSDMSDYDPANPIIPTGDTIKIAVVAAFSGPSAFNGQSYFFIAQWVAHDINKRGGLMVDGKKKLIEVIKADHMSKVDQCKKVTERMALQEKVHFFWGTDGSHFMKIINETANKYKIIAINVPSLSDDLQDATNFSRYAFHSSYSTEQIARGLAYYYGQIRSCSGGRLQERLERILSRGANCRRRFSQTVPYGLRALPGEDQGIRRRSYFHRRLASRRGQSSQAGPANGTHAAFCKCLHG
jgi:hypothetical protein